jgi:hypothetical protein
MENLKHELQDASFYIIVKERNKCYEDFLAVNGISRTGSMKENMLKEISFLRQQIAISENEIDYSCLQCNLIGTDK